MVEAMIYLLRVGCPWRDLSCLFNLRYTAKVKTLVSQMQRSGAAWQPAEDGWEVMEARLKLTGWSRERRVVLVREAPAIAPVRLNGRRRRDRMDTGLPGFETENCPAPWAGKIAVFVTTLDPVAYPSLALARLYRERADAENIYDELKNQWGWGGFTTKKLGPCRLMANLVALIYNWWHLYATCGSTTESIIAKRSPAAPPSWAAWAAWFVTVASAQ